MKNNFKTIRLFIVLGIAFSAIAVISITKAFAYETMPLTFHSGNFSETKKEVDPKWDASINCGSTITDRDGFSYNTVAIGTQCWMAENLKTKTKPSGEEMISREDDSERDCMSSAGDERGTETDCEAGRTLYSITAAMNNTTDENTQGICPTGWHIPSDSDWHTLEANLANSTSSCDPNRIGSGCSNAGTRMLTTGNSGFNADYSGIRVWDGHYPNTFIGWNSLMVFWSSTLNGPEIAYGRYIGDWNTDVIDRGTWGVGTGDNVNAASVRCISDQPIPEEPTCGSLLVDRDNYSYQTVKIGEQCWMANGLRTKTKPDGTCINGGTAPCADASINDNSKGRSCYNNNEANCAIDGALYNYQAALNGTLITPQSNLPVHIQGICPDGWHVPSVDEFTTLFRSICTSENCADTFPYTYIADNDRGTTEGNKLKVGGSSGFNATMSGQRATDGRTFQNKDLFGYFRTTIHDYTNSSTTGYRIVLYAGSNGLINRAYSQDQRSMPLRCIQD